MSDTRIKVIIPNAPATPKEGTVIQEEGGPNDGSVWRHNGRAWVKIYPSDVITYRLQQLEKTMADLVSVMAKEGR